MESKTDGVFLDSSLFKALVDEDDDFYPEAKEIWIKFNKEARELFTSNFILDETFTLIRVRCGLEKALKLKEGFLAGLARFKVIRISLEDEKNAWGWFLKEWSGLSFTDCTSFAVMRRLGIKRVATFDKHFHQAGFQIEK